MAEPVKPGRSNSGPDVFGQPPTGRMCDRDQLDPESPRPLPGDEQRLVEAERLFRSGDHGVRATSAAASRACRADTRGRRQPAGDRGRGPLRGVGRLGRELEDPLVLLVGRLDRPDGRCEAGDPLAPGHRSLPSSASVADHAGDPPRQRRLLHGQPSLHPPFSWPGTLQKNVKVPFFRVAVASRCPPCPPPCP